MRKLTKAARTAIAVTGILLLVAGIAFAAWQFTKQTTGTAMVHGSFSVDVMECEDVFVGDEDVDKTCVFSLVNSSGGPMTIADVTMTEDFDPGISFQGAWYVEGHGNPGEYDVPIEIPEGAQVNVVALYRVGTVGANEGPINFVAYVTGMAN